MSKSLFRPVAPLSAGDFVCDVHGNYGQIEGCHGDRLVVEWIERSDIFFVGTQ